MRFILPLALLLIPPIVCAQSRDDDSIKGLIRKLGSGNYLERETAAKVLQERPDAIPSLRDAIQSSDAETRKRAAEILDYLDLRPVRELDSAIKNGRMDKVTAQLAHWPKGKHEEAAWHAVRELARNLVDRHERLKGEKVKLAFDGWGKHIVPVVLSEKRITETTRGQRERPHFLRAGDVDLDFTRLEPGVSTGPFLEDCPVIVAARSVRVPSAESRVIFAGSYVEIVGEPHNNVVVCCGDVLLACNLSNSLVIAQGKVTSTGRLDQTRIISGKSVTHTSKNKTNIIMENEANPLGYVRWADNPKEKAAPKKQ